MLLNSFDFLRMGEYLIYLLYINIKRTCMKSLFTSLFLGIIFLITSCNSGFKIVENPVFISFNSTSVSITKVEINDTATVLHIDANYTPNYWIKISSETYLKADGVKYMIKTGDGIELDKEFWLPESGNASFILTFDPLPLKTKSFDFPGIIATGSFKLTT